MNDEDKQFHRTIGRLNAFRVVLILAAVNSIVSIVSTIVLSVALGPSYGLTFAFPAAVWVGVAFAMNKQYSKGVEEYFGVANAVES